MTMTPECYEHDMEALRDQRDELLTALTRLANEASGFLSMADIFAHGHTNVAVLTERIIESRAIIAKVLNR